jgi:superfamily II RNA helicase
MFAHLALLMNCYQVVQKIGLQVEDMLKRSFAEFHAQKKLPEMQQLLKRKLNQPTKVIEYVNYPFSSILLFKA